MNEILYSVENEYGSVIANNMNLENVIIFVKALFETYVNEEGISYKIVRQKGFKE